VEKIVRRPESHHETDPAAGPISGEPPEVALSNSARRENGAIHEHDDKGNDLKNVLNGSRSSELVLRQNIDKIPALAWCNLPDGSSEITQVSLRERRIAGGRKAAIHPEDLSRLTKWRILSDPEPGEYEVRLRRSDGVFRWFLFRIEPPPIRVQSFREAGG
jgi:hypothetical protein